MLDQLEEIMPPDGDPTVYTLYGDLAMYLIGGFCNEDVGTDEALSIVYHVLCENYSRMGFGTIIEQWKFLDF